jgi:hypothetical protein
MKDFLTTLALYTESLDCAEKVAVEFANYVNGTKDNPTSVEEFFLKYVKPFESSVKAHFL